MMLVLEMHHIVCRAIVASYGAPAAPGGFMPGC
jgi:hypothetical protein